MISVIIPANNECEYISPCLMAVWASEGVATENVEVIVVANGCTDGTAEIARSFQSLFAARGMNLIVCEIITPGKIIAIREGERLARGPMRAYLDADVTIGPDLLQQIVEALDCNMPRFASGTPQIAEARSWVTQQFRRVFLRLPFMRDGVPGFGFFAVNAAGRARWGAFPNVISDDTFVRLNFTREQRIRVPAHYTWPLVEGFRRLVSVRRRQDRGVREIRQRFPDMWRNDDKRPLSKSELMALALRDPMGFAVYAGVLLCVRLTPRRAAGIWTRRR